MKTVHLLAGMGPMGAPEVLVIAGFFLYLGAWIWAMVDCVRAESGWAQGTWLIFIILFGFAVAPLYLLCRKLPRSLSKTPAPKQPANLFCCRCGQRHSGSHKVGISGITKFSCAACGETNKFPAPVAVQTVYWVVVGMIVFAAGTGNLTGNDGLGFGALVLLVLGLTWTTESLSASKKVGRAKQFHQSRARPAVTIKGPPQKPQAPPIRRVPPRIR